MFGSYESERRAERRARDLYKLYKLVQEERCTVEFTEAGGAPKTDQLIGHRDGSTDAAGLVKMQKQSMNELQVPGGHSSARVFVSSRGQAFGLYRAIRRSPFFISDVYTHPFHVEAEIGENPDGEPEVQLQDVTTQIILKYEAEAPPNDDSDD